MAASRHVGGLLLQLPREVFNLFFFTIEIDVHLLGTSPQSGILIVCNIVLNLEVAI